MRKTIAHLAALVILISSITPRETAAVITSTFAPAPNPGPAPAFNAGEYDAYRQIGTAQVFGYLPRIAAPGRLQECSSLIELLPTHYNVRWLLESSAFNTEDRHESGTMPIYYGKESQYFTSVSTHEKSDDAVRFSRCDGQFLFRRPRSGRSLLPARPHPRHFKHVVPGYTTQEYLSTATRDYNGEDMYDGELIEHYYPGTITYIHADYGYLLRSFEPFSITSGQNAIVPSQWLVPVARYAAR